MTCSSVEIKHAMRAWLRLALLLLAPMAVAGEVAPTNAAAPPSAEVAAIRTGYVAEYELLRDGKKEGAATVSLRALDDGRWELRNLTTGTSGMAALLGLRIEEHSLVSWRHGRPQTEGYRYAQKMAFRKRTRSVVVDRDAGQIIGRDSRDDKNRIFALRDGILDRQSVNLALAADLGNGAAGALEYAVVGRHAISTWQFQIEQHAAIDTPAGCFDATVASRTRDDDGRVTRTWFARLPTPDARAMLPVRVEQTEPGKDTLVMQLRSYSVN